MGRKLVRWGLQVDGLPADVLLVAGRRLIRGGRSLPEPPCSNLRAGVLADIAVVPTTRIAYGEEEGGGGEEGRGRMGDVT